MKASSSAAPRRTSGPAIDPQRYVPAYINWISNKLSRGASQHYLKCFGVGIEVWRILLLLTQQKTLTAQEAARVIGMDKASVSRAFKAMQAQGLITLSLRADPPAARIQQPSSPNPQAPTPPPAIDSLDTPNPGATPAAKP